MKPRRDPFWQFLEDHEKDFSQLCVADKIGYDRAVDTMRKRYPMERDAGIVFGKERERK